MRKKHRSIGQRFDKAKLPETKARVLYEWATEWEKQTLGLIAQLERGVSTRDFDAQCISLGHLKEDLIKRFDALPRVLIKALEFVPSECDKKDDVDG